MPTFGRRSELRLRTCDQRLQRVMRRAIRAVDFTVVDGHRGEDRQERYFAEGKSTKRWPDSNHNTFPSRAIDVAPWVDGGIPWDDLRYWYVLCGAIMMAAADEGVELRWGGDWDRGDDFNDEATRPFNDLGHYELAPEEET